MTSTTTPTVTNLDKVCRNIGRLPLEMRHAIFNCLTVDFRLEMVLQKKAHIIRKLYEAYNERILDIPALQKIVDLGIRHRFFYRKWTNDPLKIQPNLRRWMPNIEFKQMGDIVSTQHPAFKALREIVVIPTIHGQIDSTSRRVHPARHASESLTKIVSTITKSCDILPTFTVPLGHGKEANVSKLRQKNNFKRLVARYIPNAFRKMQRKIKLSAKIAKSVAIEAAKEAAKEARETKAAAKEAAKEARETKAAAKEAAKETKAATKKATKEAKEAAKNKK